MNDRRPILLVRAVAAAALLACAAPAARAAAEPAPARAPSEAAKKEAFERASKGAARVQDATRLMASGDYAGAEKALIEADRLVPDYCTVLIPLSSVQLRLGKPDAALATLERAIRRGKAFDDKAYLLAARIFSDRKQFGPGEKSLIEWAGDRPVTANFHAAIGILRMGNYELGPAELELREALKLDPANEAALTGMNELYGRLDQYPKLQRFLDAGLEKKPDSVPILLLCGNSLLRQERFAEAKDKYERILKVDPKNATAMVNLGSTLHGLGDTQGATAWFRKAIEADGRNVEAPVNLARALSDAGKPSEARDVLLAARKRGLDSPEVLNSLVVVYRLMKDYDAAMAVAEESLKKVPSQPLLRKYQDDIEKERQAAAAASGSPAKP